MYDDEMKIVSEKSSTNQTIVQSKKKKRDSFFKSGLSSDLLSDEDATVWSARRNFRETHQAMMAKEYPTTLIEWMLMFAIAPLCVGTYCVLCCLHFSGVFALFFVTKLNFVGWRSKTSLVGIIHCRYTETVKIDDVYDFYLHRTPCYLEKLCFEIPRIFIRYLAGHYDKVQVWTDEEMMVSLQTNMVARALSTGIDEVTGQVSHLVFDFDPSNQQNALDAEGVSRNPYNYISANKLVADCVTKELSINIAGRVDPVFRPKPELKVLHPVKYAFQLQKWNLAKAHLQCAVLYNGVATTHNWTHFHFMDIIAAHSGDVLPAKSTIGILVGTHLRFTSMINSLGPAYDFFAPGAQSTSFVRHVPWKWFVMSTKAFVNGVAERSVSHYVKKDEAGNRRVDPKAFPPTFVMQRTEPNNLRDLAPYLDFNAEVYFAIEDFVRSIFRGKAKLRNGTLVDLIERDLVDQWVRHLESKHLPGLTAIDEDPIERGIRILSTMMWTPVVHYCDHVLWYEMATHSGMFSSAHPWKEDGHWKDVLQGQGYKTFKTAVFANLFVECKDSWFTGNKDKLTSPHLYQEFKKIEITQKRAALQMLHQDFLANMRTIKEKWSWALNCDDIPASVCD